MMAEVEGQAKASRKQQNKVKKDKRDSEKTVKRSRARVSPPPPATRSSLYPDRVL